MKIFGKELKFNNFDVWHKGNFNPDNKANVDLQTGQMKAIGFAKAFLSSVLGDDITIRGMSQLRFSDSFSWDWNAWAGLKYDSSNKKIYIGGAGGVFDSNGSGTKVTMDLTNQVDKVLLPSSSINGNAVATVNQIPTSLPANGGNSDTVGGKHASDFACSSVGNSDLNTIIQSGMYRINNGLSNAPLGVEWGQLLVIHGGADTITQIVTDYSSNNIYWRSGNPSNVGGGGEWEAWRRIWHDGNLNPPTKLSQLQNDIGAGGGTNIVCSSTEPTGLKSGEWWYKG